MTFPFVPNVTSTSSTISLYGRWSTSGSDRGKAHFFTATSNTIEGTGEKRQNKWTKRLGLTQVQKESYVTLCMCRLTLVWILAKLLQSYWNADSIIFHWSGSSLCCPVSTASVRRPSPPANISVPLSHSLTGVPSALLVTSRSRVQNPCLVSRQNRQRNRLLGGPLT